MIAYNRNYNINFINGVNYINEIPNDRIIIKSNVSNRVNERIIDNINLRFHYNEDKSIFVFLFFYFPKLYTLKLK